MPPLLPFYYLCHINPHKIMEMLRYFYHPDHASASLSNHASAGLSNLWITDGTGQAIQHLHYLPFGEDWVDQRNSSWNTPYTFSGKEKDVETGYGYVKKLSFFSSLAFGNEKQVFHYDHCLRRIGARYYDSGLSIWLSVDPMSDKYPSMSPYNYCANNPVILVDPDGRYFITAEDNDKVALYKLEIASNKSIYQSKIDDLKKNGGSQEEINNFTTLLKEVEGAEVELNQLIESTTGYTFTNNYDAEAEGQFYVEQRDGNTVGVINLSSNTSGVFAHELKHAFQFDNKEVSYLSDGKTIGTLSGFYTEREAYDRGQAFGQFNMSDAAIQNKYSSISCRKNKVSLNNDYGLQNILPVLIKNNEIYKK